MKRSTQALLVAILSNVSLALAESPCSGTMSAAALISAATKASASSKTETAETCLRLCTLTHTSDHTCFSALGQFLTDQQRFVEAHVPLFRAIQLHTAPTTWDAFAKSYSRRGRPDLMHVDLGALQIRNAIDQNNKNLFDDAVSHLNKALELNPDCVEAHSHLFNLYSVHLHNKALANHHLDRANHLDPDNPAAIYTRGTQYFAKSDFENALAQFERAAALSPSLGPAVSNRFYLRKRVCEWGNFSKELTRIEELVRLELEDSRNVYPSVHPYQAISYNIPPPLKLDLTRRFALREIDSARRMGLDVMQHSHTTRRPHRRLRIGYLSTDFRLKATAYLIQDMFRHHERSKFQIFCLALTEDDGSVWRKLISSQCENFIDVSRNSVQTIVSLIHDKYEIDILIDMDGYCNEGIRKTEILAVQPAPIQMHMLVYPGTMGADFIQYLVADPHNAPPEHFHLFHEKILVMPHSYFINSHRQLFESSQILHQTGAIRGKQLKLSDSIQQGEVVNAYGETRATFDLPRGKFVFCSFNSHYKFDPELWGIWMDLLSSVPSSVLWLLRFPPESEGRLRKEASKRGIDPVKQIIWSEYINDPEKNLRRLRFADVVLDTFHYGAHTGCADALFAGVPVVTMAGNQFASRVCTGQMRVVGLGHLVANSTREYAKIASKLAQDASLLQRTRQHLDQVRNTTPLFDTARWVRNLESGFTKVWDRFTSGLAPDHVLADDVGPSDSTRDASVTASAKLESSDTDTTLAPTVATLIEPEIDAVSSGGDLLDSSGPVVRTTESSLGALASLAALASLGKPPPQQQQRTHTQSDHSEL